MSLKNIVAMTAAVVMASATPSALAETGSLVELTQADTVVGGLNVNVGELTGMEVYGPDGEAIGDVDNVLADTSGKAKAVTVDVGGFLGVGAREVVLPISKLMKGQESDELTTSLTRDQIEKLEDWRTSTTR